MLVDYQSKCVGKKNFFVLTFIFPLGAGLDRKHN